MICILMNMKDFDKFLSTLIVILVVHKYVSLVNQVLDDKNVRRRFRASNYQSTTRVKPFICTMPMRLDDGWNQIQFNLSDFTRRAYGTNYIETLRVQVKKCFCRIKMEILKNIETNTKSKPSFIWVLRSLLICSIVWCLYRFMPIVGFEEYTSQTDYIQKMNYRQNSSYTYLSKTRRRHNKQYLTIRTF